MKNFKMRQKKLLEKWVLFKLDGNPYKSAVNPIRTGNVLVNLKQLSIEILYESGVNRYTVVPILKFTSTVL